MEVAIRDIKIEHIKCELEHKKKNLLKKLILLNKNVKENSFLEDVVGDYKKYNDFIVKQKKEQLDAFNIILEYLDRITMESKLTDVALGRAQHDQKTILREMDKIKDELDEMISSSNIE